MICLCIVGGVFLGAVLHGLTTDYDGSELVHTAEAATTTPVAQEVRIEVAIDWTKERLEQELRTVAKKYNVSYEKLHRTVACESGFKTDIQSGHRLSYGREESWGIAQFHLPSKNRTADGKVITKDMALDPAIALDAMAYHFSTGNAKAWTCYRDLYMR